MFKDLRAIAPRRSARRGLLAVLLVAAGLAHSGCKQTTLAETLPPGEQTDVFSQLPKAQSDILWIIDDSGSMAREQDQLADSFPKFFAHLQDAQVDYRIAVTTSDIFAQNGALVGNPSIIVGNSQDSRVANTPNPQTAFATNIHVGTSGSARDEALENALLALQKLEVEAGAAEDAGQAVTFLRPGAALFLIFVGDGTDYSPSYDLAGVQYYWREYLQAKGIGDDTLVSVAAIAGDLPNGCYPQGCAGADVADGGEADPGVRYYELVELAGGLFGSICDCTFDTTLDLLGIQALGLTHKFRLTRQADPTGISVEVDYPCGTVDPTDNLVCDPLAATCPSGIGAQCTASCDTLGLACTVPELSAADGGDPTDGWVYNASDNSITFDGATVPSAAAQVKVTYTVGGTNP